MNGGVAAVSGLPRQVCIVGAQGLVRFGDKANAPSTTSLLESVLSSSLEESRLAAEDLDGLVAVPSLTESHFMEAHYQATRLGLFDSRRRGGGMKGGRRPIRLRTIDTGGAGPVTALLEATRMIKTEALEVVAIVASDSVASMDSRAFLRKADSVLWKLKDAGSIQEASHIRSPAIPFGYDRVTEYQMGRYGVTRDQLRMAVCLDSLHAGKHPDSLYYRKSVQESDGDARGEADCVRYTSLAEVQEAKSVMPNISLLECARRADGAACLILASNRFLKRRNLYRKGLPVVIGGGEASGPLYPPATIDETMFSCEDAMEYAYAQAGNLTHEDIDFFGLYDCFPICLVRALEACGLSEKGRGGEYLERQYQRLMGAMAGSDKKGAVDSLFGDKSFFPVNTHGGLLCYGAPWEVPAMYNIVEAVQQLRGEARGRQIKNCRRALVYGNGGIFSASAVGILAKSL